MRYHRKSYNCNPVWVFRDHICSVSAENSPGAILGFHSVSGSLRRTIRGEADVWYRPKVNEESLAVRYSVQRSRLLVPMRLDTVTGRLTAL